MLGRSKERTAGFRERCARLCDDACRRATLRERMMLQQLWLGLKA